MKKQKQIMPKKKKNQLQFYITDAKYQKKKKNVLIMCIVLFNLKHDNKRQYNRYIAVF